MAAPQGKSVEPSQGATPATRNALRFCSRCAYGVTFAGFTALAVTGFVGWWGYGHASGWLLLVHSAVSPLFIVGLTLMALFWAERCRFGLSDAAQVQCAGQRLAFWATLVLGFVSMVSILAAMLTVFGYAVQDWLYGVHRTSAVGLLVVAVLHAALMITARRSR